MRDPDECIGSGARPRDYMPSGVRGSIKRESDGRRSRLCPVCGQRIMLDSDELIRRHDRREPGVERERG
jgi:hypothetical protein